MSDLELGRRGENLAAEFLISAGFTILQRNWRIPAGEIDILAKIQDEIVVVEVKTQSSATYSDPVYKVDAAKQRKLRLLMRIIAARYPDQNIRLDVITIYWHNSQPVITHLQDVLS